MSAANDRRFAKGLLIADAITLPILAVCFAFAMIDGDAFGAGSLGLFLGVVSMRAAGDYGRWLRVR